MRRHLCAVVAVLLLGGVAAAAAGCFELGLPFRCDEPSECRLGGQQGWCEANRFCSFPSEQCASGRVYLDDPYRNQCVDTDLGPGPLDGPAPDLAALTDGAALDAAMPADGTVDDLAASSDGGLDDLAVPLADLSTRPDLAGRDFARPDVDAGCAYPQLLITAEDLEPSTQIGQVLRYHIPATGPLVACTPLSGSGALAPLVQAAAFLPPDRIAVAGREWLTILDPATDAITQTWPVSSALLAKDVAPIQTANGTEAAVFYRQTGFGEKLSELTLYKEGQPDATRTWLASELTLQNALGMTVDPWNKTRLMFLDDRVVDPQAAELVDPFSGLILPYLILPSSINYLSIAAFSNGAGARIVWAAHNTYVGFYGYNAGTAPTDAGYGWQPYGPTQCGSCDVLHAVPDPTDYVRAFLLCETDGAINTRTVKRAKLQNGNINGFCTDVLNGTSLGARTRLTRLAIACRDDKIGARMKLGAALVVMLGLCATARAEEAVPLGDAERTQRARAHFERGKAHFNLREYEAAVREFEAGYRDKPQPLFLFNIGNAARRAGQPKKALDMFRRYLAEKPDAVERREVTARIAELEKLVASLPPEKPAETEPPISIPETKSRTETQSNTETTTKPTTETEAKAKTETPTAAKTETPAMEKKSKPTPAETRPWSRDPLAAVLTATGAAALIAGAVELGLHLPVWDHRDADYQSRQDALAARPHLYAGVALIPVGAALVAGGALRYGLEARRQRKAGLNVAAAPNALELTVAGEF